MRVPSTNGVEIKVHDLGGEGPPLVLAHATGFHGRVWEPLAAHLTGFHLWSIDMRAHGDSTAPEIARSNGTDSPTTYFRSSTGLASRSPSALGTPKAQRHYCSPNRHDLEHSRRSTSMSLWWFQPTT